MSISLSDAEKVLQAAQKQAASMGINVSIAVVDPRGDLVALARMDGARYFTADIARGKAMASASFGAPSGAFAEHAGSPIFKAINDSNLGRMVFHQGGVPILQGGTLSGGVGVSGASSQQDEEVAKAGAAAL
ncbi:MAG: heme-binding protein [Vicinamibacterales bacterium]